MNNVPQNGLAPTQFQRTIDMDAVDIAPGKARIWPYILIGLLAVVGLFGGFGAWAYTAQIDGAVIADAKFAVKSKRKVISHLEGGVVSQILVGEGDNVKAGQVLVKLDPTIDRTNLTVVDAELDQLIARRERLLAELNGEEELVFVKGGSAGDIPIGLLEARQGQKALFNARLQSRLGALSIGKKRIAKLNEEITGIEEQITSNQTQINLIGKELKGLRKLEKRKLVPRSRLLALEREAERLRGQSAALQVNIARAANSIGEVELESVQAKRQFDEQVNEEMRAIEPRIGQLTEQRVAASRKLDQVEIRAPTDGFVVSLNANTIGGVIRPGSDIMEIVPASDGLILEARVSTADVEKVRAGNDARVQLTAFDQTRTPEALGEVLSVSADRLEDERTGEQYYLARLSLKSNQVAEIERLELVPGMPATVFIQTGARTAMSYLLQPLNDRLKRSLVES